MSLPAGKRRHYYKIANATAIDSSSQKDAEDVEVPAEKLPVLPCPDLRDEPFLSNPVYAHDPKYTRRAEHDVGATKQELPPTTILNIYNKIFTHDAEALPKAGEYQHPVLSPVNKTVKAISKPNVTPTPDQKEDSETMVTKKAPEPRTPSPGFGHFECFTTDIWYELLNHVDDKARIDSSQSSKAMYNHLRGHIIQWSLTKGEFIFPYLRVGGTVQKDVPARKELIRGQDTREFSSFTVVVRGSEGLQLGYISNAAEAKEQATECKDNTYAMLLQLALLGLAAPN